MIYPPSQEKAWIPGKDEKNIDENLPIEVLEIHDRKNKEEALKEIEKNLTYLENKIIIFVKYQKANPKKFKEKIKENERIIDYIDDIITATGIRIFEYGQKEYQKRYSPLLESWEKLKDAYNNSN